MWGMSGLGGQWPGFSLGKSEFAFSSVEVCFSFFFFSRDRGGRGDPESSKNQ